MTEHDPLDGAAWAVNRYSWSTAEKLADGLGVPLVVGMVLAGRGFTDPRAARQFLDCDLPLPDPFLFRDMEAAVDAISRVLDEGGRIVVHGDYDADGITATAAMVLGLRDLGRRAEWYLPNRFNEGYGLSRRAVEAIAEGGPALLITVDCGVNYPEEVAYAQSLGLEVVVIDHHRPGPRLPDCYLIHEAVGDYPHGDLCGVGLALKVLHALHVRRSGARPDTLPDELRGLLDLVALGTIADLAPLRGENRYYVKEGLKLITIGRRPGLRALCSVAGCTGSVDSGTVAYRLAPRLNAAGRLADPSPPLRLLLTDDEGEATNLAARLHELNGARQEVERQMLEEALRRVEELPELPPAIVLAGQEWHEGVVGIVASRLVERFHRPTVLLGVRDGVAKGSGRSIPPYDLMGGLNACSQYLTVYGGHAQAAGLTLEAERVDEFTRALTAHAGRLLGAGDFTPVYQADAVLRGQDITADTATALAALGPFGSGNPRPKLLLVGAELQQAEATRNGAHLRCTVCVDGVKTRAIGFGMGSLAGALREAAGPRAVGVELRVDQWQGTLRPEFLLEQIGPVAEETELQAKAGGGLESAGPVTPGIGPRGAAADRAAGGESAAERGQSGVGDALERLHLPRARDLRDDHSASSAVAQVLACAERVLLVACSIPRAATRLRRRIALQDVWGDGMPYADRGTDPQALSGLRNTRVAMVEWEVAAGAYETAAPWDHVVVLDPPYRPGHVALLHKADGENSKVHLCYAEADRQAAARLLRYLVHPRFAMVCLYRAMQEGGHSRAGLFARAAEIGWEEARLVLTRSDLERAARILGELGVEGVLPGEHRLEPRSVSAYVAAEADYEECSRLCLTL